MLDDKQFKQLVAVVRVTQGKGNPERKGRVRNIRFIGFEADPVIDEMISAGPIIDLLRWTIEDCAVSREFLKLAIYPELSWRLGDDKEPVIAHWNINDEIASVRSIALNIVNMGHLSPSL